MGLVLSGSNRSEDEQTESTLDTFIDHKQTQVKSVRLKSVHVGVLSNQIGVKKEEEMNLLSVHSLYTLNVMPLVHFSAELAPASCRVCWDVI